MRKRVRNVAWSCAVRAGAAAAAPLAGKSELCLVLRRLSGRRLNRNGAARIIDERIVVPSGRIARWSGFAAARCRWATSLSRTASDVGAPGR